MRNTLTFTARGADDSRQVATLTLHDHFLSVDAGPPVEQFERASVEQPSDLRQLRDRLWLRPLILSLLQRESGAYPVSDVSAAMEGDYLTVKAWLRAAGLRAIPVTLVDARVDNPPAARAFIAELDARQQEAEGPSALLEPLEYWGTWVLAAVVTLSAAIFLWRRYRRRG